MAKINPISLFLVILISLLAIAFLAHTVLLQSKGLEKYGNMIILSYVVNFLLATIIYVGLYIFRNNLKTQIGFVFMAGSFIKFIFFFILFYPSYTADGEIVNAEFAAFFVPYCICLVLETIFTARMLRKME